MKNKIDKMHRISDARQEWIEANTKWDQGDIASAYKLFLTAAHKGLADAQNSIGYFIDNGIGTPEDKLSALRWYKMAAKQGNSCAISNIGTIYRDVGNINRAIFWFGRAYRKYNDGDAGLEIVKILISKGVTDNNISRAREILTNICRSSNITEESRGEVEKIIAYLDLHHNQKT